MQGFYYGYPIENIAIKRLEKIGQPQGIDPTPWNPGLAQDRQS